jgi:hypothetical protein
MSNTQLFLLGTGSPSSYIAWSFPPVVVDDRAYVIERQPKNG